MDSICIKKNLKKDSGVTLTALVIYMGIFSMILAIMGTVSGFFYRNIRTVNDPPAHISEFNKFSMFFVADVKKYPDANLVNDTTVEFPDGTRYTLRGNSVYRNDLKIASKIKSLKFTKKNYTVNNITKNIIQVEATIGNSRQEVKQNIDFVLKYW